jgi:hypothetical protein
MQMQIQRFEDFLGIALHTLTTSTRPSWTYLYLSAPHSSATLICSNDHALSDLPHINHAPNAVSIMHIVEGLINTAEVLTMRDELVDLELAVHVVGDETRHLCAALHAAESAAFPSATSDKLEGYAQSQLAFKD